MSSLTPAQIYTDNLKIGNTINLTICEVLGYLKSPENGVLMEIKISTLVSVTDLLVSIGVLFSTKISQITYNIIKYYPNWCKFYILATDQLVIYSGYNLGVIIM
ncbi:hypothetical protein CONCODRAFT_12643 [Conidiobolus coronatus NRRL 28638]|uniref:Uncharacterized protein n=1 Tax=Conidiobolus coronatus (strain ATCC 28846 / CBS 209.66 / NRRL 28638) TaxID=796925 RepID=A0A137NSG8_CONC2|nr:hypothetical protein CONCODRAFT_12643 [Conidiobolus coronatus NRRL 28638]|eukprot:KXN65698.1 hypothetical protein CONCODRAFT_12643 [Conidiobolus coronatus NRRL 28638]